MRHELKILPQYYDDCVDGIKTFELRKDDRNYQVDDTLVLKEWNGKEFTGRSYPFLITYVLRDVPQYGLQKGFVIIGIR